MSIILNFYDPNNYEQYKGKVHNLVMSLTFAVKFYIIVLHLSISIKYKLTNNNVK